MSICCDQCTYQIDMKIKELRELFKKNQGDFESMGQLQAQIEILKEIIDDKSDGPEHHWYERYE